MKEKRRHKRHARRFKVRYGQKGFEHTAFTGDISASGMFIIGPAPKLDSRIHIEVVVDPTRSLFMEGVVQRLAVAPPELRQVTRSGFGVRILSQGELFGEIMPVSKAALSVRYARMEELQRAFDEEIKRGGVFVQAPTAPAVNSVVALDIESPFLGETVNVQVRVVHVVAQPSGGFGVAVVFTDPPLVLGEMTRLLGKPP